MARFGHFDLQLGTDCIHWADQIPNSLSRSVRACRPLVFYDLNDLDLFAVWATYDVYPLSIAH